jgi:hypothetical protein
MHANAIQNMIKEITDFNTKLTNLPIQNARNSITFEEFKDGQLRSIGSSIDGFDVKIKHMTNDLKTLSKSILLEGKFQWHVIEFWLPVLAGLLCIMFGVYTILTK